jgi:hypothetical protein
MNPLGELSGEEFSVCCGAEVVTGKTSFPEIEQFY